MAQPCTSRATGRASRATRTGRGARRPTSWPPWSSPGPGTTGGDDHPFWGSQADADPFRVEERVSRWLWGSAARGRSPRPGPSTASRAPGRGPGAGRARGAPSGGARRRASTPASSAPTPSCRSPRGRASTWRTATSCSQATRAHRPGALASEPGDALGGTLTRGPAPGRPRRRPARRRERVRPARDPLEPAVDVVAQDRACAGHVRGRAHLAGVSGPASSRRAQRSACWR